MLPEGRCCIFHFIYNYQYPLDEKKSNVPLQFNSACAKMLMPVKLNQT